MQKKIYFVSDCHLGVPTKKASMEREKRLVSWLDTIKKDAQEIFFVGDIFDFWFEYSTVVPKGYTRLFGKIAEITDSGIPIHFFKGNHDMWLSSYFKEELGMIIHDNELIKTWHNTTFFIAHGDGIGRGDLGFKLIKKLFRSPFNQWLFKWIHPDFSMGIALWWSRKSRKYNEKKEGNTLPSIEKERLFVFAQEQAQKKNHSIQHYVFGHRHHPCQQSVNKTTSYTNLGDWITYFSYAVFDGEQLLLKTFKD